MVYKKIPDKRTARLLAILCAFVYGAAYLTRYNFGTVTVDIIDKMGWDSIKIAAVTSTLFITYGACQILSGWLGDKLPPQYLMAGGLGCSVILNLLIPFCTTIPQMTVIWGINGVAQSMLWPPLIRVTAGLLKVKDYQESTVIISCGSSIGTILLYLLSSLLVGVSGWKAVFFACAGIAAIVVISFIIIFPKFKRYADTYGVEELPEQETTEKAGTSSEAKKRMSKALLITTAVILISIIPMGMLRDSITTWMPKLIKDTSTLSSSSSILMSVAIPLCNLAIYPLVLAYYRKFFKNELACATTLFLYATIILIILYFVFGVSPYLSVLMLSLICTFMHGVNFMLIGLVPKKYEAYGKIGLMSGVLNSFVYIGSSVSIYLIPLIVENSRNGWNASILVWAIAAVIGTLLCGVVIKSWGKLFKK